MLSPTQNPLAEARFHIRQIILLIWRQDRSVQYHVSKLRSFLDDVEKCKKQTSVEDFASYQLRIPTLINEIAELGQRLKSAWPKSREHNNDLPRLCELFDEVQLRPLVYEKLVRQTEKPFVETARQLRGSAPDNPDRAEFENLIQTRVEDFLDEEAEIDRHLRVVDELRDRFAAENAGVAEKYASVLGDGSPFALATAQVAVRLAANYFDERSGFSFSEYAKHWIQNKFEESGHSETVTL